LALHFGPTTKGPIAITWQSPSRLAQLRSASLIASCSETAFSPRPGWPDVPTATAFQPVEAWLKSIADWTVKVPLIFEGIHKMPPVAPDVNEQLGIAHVERGPQFDEPRHERAVFMRHVRERMRSPRRAPIGERRAGVAVGDVPP